MSLDKLVGISLEKVEPDSASIARLLAAARRNIADATIMASVQKTVLMLPTKRLCNWQMLHCRRMASGH